MCVPLWWSHQQMGGDRSTQQGRGDRSTQVRGRGGGNRSTQDGRGDRSTRQGMVGQVYPGVLHGLYPPIQDERWEGTDSCCHVTGVWW